MKKTQKHKLLLLLLQKKKKKKRYATSVLKVFVMEVNDSKDEGRTWLSLNIIHPSSCFLDEDEEEEEEDEAGVGEEGEGEEG
jgi:hypothetical protein